MDDGRNKGEERQGVSQSGRRGPPPHPRPKISGKERSEGCGDKGAEKDGGKQDHSFLRGLRSTPTDTSQSSGPDHRSLVKGMRAKVFCQNGTDHSTTGKVRQGGFLQKCPESEDTERTATWLCDSTTRRIPELAASGVSTMEREQRGDPRRAAGQRLEPSSASGPLPRRRIATEAMKSTKGYSYPLAIAFPAAASTMMPLMKKPCSRCTK